VDHPAPEFVSLQRAVTGRYSLDRELGRGGMGIVYLARDVALDRPVAIKRLPPHLAADSALRARFLQEARTAGQLSHPNIVPIHAVEEHGDVVFFVMSYVEGETLGARIRRLGRLLPDPAARILREVAWALAYAHQRGVIHRDVKPDNILLERGGDRALVTDFGIARVTAAGPQTATGDLVGTAHYMSPEQASGQPVDGRSDLYALGVTGFYALTGRLPFDAPTAAAVLARHLTETPPSVAGVRPDVPAPVGRVIDRCLAKDPAARFATGEALADALDRAARPAIEVAPRLRNFIRDARRAGVELGAYGAALFYLFISLPFDVLFSADLLAFMVLIGGLGVGRLAQAVAAASRAMRDGFSLDDVHAALAREAEAAARDQAETGGSDPLRPRGPARLVIGLGGLGGLGLGGLLMRQALRDSASEMLVFLALGGFLALAGAGLLAAALHLPIAGPALRRMFGVGRERQRADWYHGLPGGWFGRLCFFLGYRGMPEEWVGPPALTVGPQATEVVLGEVVEALYRALPPALRRAVADVPDVLRTLTAHAERLRGRIRALDQAAAEAAAGPGPDAGAREAVVAELAVTRRATEQRLAETVAALEGIRLELLRLRAGVGAPSDLTDDLARAREIGEHVDALLAGRAETALDPQGH